MPTLTIKSSKLVCKIQITLDAPKCLKELQEREEVRSLFLSIFVYYYRTV